MKRIIYGSLSVLTAVGTAFAAAKAEVFTTDSSPSLLQEELTANKASEPSNLFKLSTAGSDELLLGAKPSNKGGFLSATQSAKTPLSTIIPTTQAQAMPAAKPGIVQPNVPSVVTPMVPSAATGELLPPAAIDSVPAANDLPIGEPTVNQLAPEVAPEVGVEADMEGDIQMKPGADRLTGDDLAAEEKRPEAELDEGLIEAEPEIIEPEMTNPGITNPGITNPGITEPGITEPGITNPGITEPPLEAPQIERDESVGEPGDSFNEPAVDEALPPVPQENITPVMPNNPVPEAPGFPAVPTEPAPGFPAAPVEPAPGFPAAPVEPAPLSPLEEDEPLNDSAAPSDDFPVGTSSRDRLIGEGFSPFQLSYLAIAGGLKEEGIPGGSMLLSAYEQGDISAADIVDAGALSNRLGTDADDQASYTNGVDRFLELLERDARAD